MKRIPNYFHQRKRNELAAAAVCILLLCSSLVLAEEGFIKPGGQDKCPVCGMFVARYPDWIAEIIFRDGAYLVFDGPKDMHTYLTKLKKFAPERKKEDVKALYVMDYYDLTPINGFNAWYVMGSDVYGPMGTELVPFQKESDAREFFKDHHGKRVLKFPDITEEVLKTLK